MTCLMNDFPWLLFSERSVFEPEFIFYDGWCAYGDSYFKF